MDPTTDLWTAIRRVLPDPEELAASVAVELDEPLDDVRLSVLIGTIALKGQLGPEAAARAAIEAELDRLQSPPATRPPSRLLAVDSLDELLAVARALEAEGSLNLETIVAIQRASGAAAARTDRPMVALLHRYAVTRRQMWQGCLVEMDAGRLDPTLLASFGRFLLLWNELTSLAVTEGYRLAEREILARDVEARRGALHELLGVGNEDPVGQARLRRVAVLHGLNPDGAYLLVAVAPLRLDSGEELLEVLAGRIGHLVGSTATGAEGIGAGIRLPAVLPLMGRIGVLALDGWAGLSRVPAILDSVLGESAWVAIGSSPINDIGSLAITYADLVDATRTARRVGARGWIRNPELLALERLLLSNRDLADATVHRELGQILADERLGGELIETLQAYFDAGENVAATARSLHLATRTVAYRLEKVAALLGHPLDAEYRRRLSAALLVHRLRTIEISEPTFRLPEQSVGS